MNDNGIKILPAVAPDTIPTKFVIIFDKGDEQHLPTRFAPYVADILLVFEDPDNPNIKINRHSIKININSIGSITPIVI